MGFTAGGAVVQAAILRVALQVGNGMGGDIGQQLGTGGCAPLVVDDGQALALTGQAQHGFGKVMAPCGIHPAGAQNQMLATRRLDGLLPLPLGLAIDRQRCRRIGLCPGAAAAAIEHIVCAVVNQPSAQAGRLQGNLPWRGGVEHARALGLTLGLVHGRVRRRIDNHIRLQRPHRGQHALGVGKIAAVLRAVPIDRRYLAQHGQAALQLPAHLAVFTEKKNFHHHGCLIPQYVLEGVGTLRAAVRTIVVGRFALNRSNTIHGRISPFFISLFLANPSMLELLRYDALMAAAASLCTCILLVLTKSWHGSFSIDSTDGIQKFHTQPTPRIGGIAIAVGVLVGFAASSHDPAAAEKRAILSAILLAGMPAFIFGLLEDLTKRVSVRARLLATMASGILGWGITGVALTHVNVPGLDWLLGFTAISVLFTAFAVGGVANAINIIDGFNGLTAGVTLIMLGAFGLIARQVGDIALAFTCLVIAASVAGFFVVNWPRGKIFLGDGGAYFLGFALAWIAVLLPERNASVSPWSSLLICIYPIAEVVMSFVRKSLRPGSHPSQPDAVHLHMLANRRWAKKLWPNASLTTQNGLTAPLLWLYTLLPCSAAVFFYTSFWATFSALIASLIFFLLMYHKLAFFRWFPQGKKD